MIVVHPCPVRFTLKRFHGRALLCAAVLCSLKAPTARGQTVYWTEAINQCTTRLLRQRSVGSATTNDLVSTSNSLGKVLVDPSARRYYWSEIGGGVGKIKRASLDATGVIDIANVTSPYSLEGFALDLSGGKIYWMEYGTSPRIRRANLDGSSPETVLTLAPGNRNPADIAVDSAAGKVYWCDRQFTPFISRANFDGSNVQPLVNTVTAPSTGVGYIALDPSAGKIYWADSAGGVPGVSHIARSNLDGSGAQDLVSYPSQRPRPRGIWVDPVCKRIYWTLSGFCNTDTDGKVLGADLDATKVDELFTGLLILTSVTVEPSPDTDGDGTPNCNDQCPNDPAKTAPGTCGCGTADTDANGNGTADCMDPMPMAGGGCCAPGAMMTTILTPAFLLGWKLRRRRLRSDR